MADDLRRRIAAALEYAMKARELIAGKDVLRASYHLDITMIELAKELDAVDKLLATTAAKRRG